MLNLRKRVVMIIRCSLVQVYNIYSSNRPHVNLREVSAMFLFLPSEIKLIQLSVSPIQFSGFVIVALR